MIFFLKGINDLLEGDQGDHLLKKGIIPPWSPPITLNTSVPRGVVYIVRAVVRLVPRSPRIAPSRHVLIGGHTATISFEVCVFAAQPTAEQMQPTWPRTFLPITC